MDWTDATMTMVYFFTGLLPYVTIPYESFSAAYLTKDFLGMKLRDRREKKTILDQSMYSVFIFVIFALYFPSGPVVSNLNKRGIFTNFWVINDDKDAKFVYQSTKVSGIMTDRPAHMKKFIKS